MPTLYKIYAQIGFSTNRQTFNNNIATAEKSPIFTSHKSYKIPLANITMKNCKQKKLSILIIFGLFFFVGFSQELSLSEYEISNPKFKDIVDSIIDYNKIQFEKNELFEYDFFYIEIRKDIVTISRVKKNVIDFDFVNGENIGYMKYRDLELMISGFNTRLIKQNDFKKKYKIIENMDSDIITTNFNSEFDYWEYKIEGDSLMVIYEPENFRKID